jgi:ABC-type polysaccharide/polyol phosphate transport system ATPase subunit
LISSKSSPKFQYGQAPMQLSVDMVEPQCGRARMPFKVDKTLLFDSDDMQIDAQRCDESIFQQHQIEHKGSVKEVMPVQKTMTDHD